MGWSMQIIDLRFGSGDSAHHLLLELYAAGNLVLTDASYKILTLLRSHRYICSPDVRRLILPCSSQLRVTLYDGFLFFF